MLTPSLSPAVRSAAPAPSPRTRSALFRLGAACAAHPRRVLLAWTLALIAAITAASTIGTRFTNEFAVPDSESQRAADILAARFPAHGSEAVLVAEPLRGTFDDAGNAAALAAMAAAARAIPHVVGVAPPVIAPDRHGALVPIAFDAPPSELAEAAAALGALADPSGRLDVAAGGEAVSFNQDPAPGAGELIGLVVAMIVLLVAFGSVPAAALPIATALTSVAIGVIAIGLIGHHMAFSSGAPMLASMLGMGAGIDYALFLVTRTREETRAGHDRVTAVARAVATSGRAVLFAGLCVVVAILGLALSGVSLVAALGFASAIVILIAMLAALTLLPALLGLLGPRLEALRVPVLRGDGRIFGRWARWISARPGRCAVLGIAVLLGLGAPTLSLRLGFPDDSVQPAGSPARRSYDLIARHFGPGTSGPIAIVIEGSAADAAHAAARVAADAEVASVTPPVASPDGGVHVVVAYPRHAPQEPEVAELVHRLRGTELAGTARVSVGGPVATTIDVADLIAAKLPLVVIAVLSATFLLLLVVFRSLVVPVKAVLLNLLSVGAAYGVLVAVFQWGIGRELVGIDHPIPIVSVLPMLLFAILFGLSMDYEVFLLARVREEHERGASAVDSVARALTSTGRVISSAALIMVSVFIAFALGPDPMVKMFGIGLAAAVLVDATLVRLVLVPALMVLMDEANWWLPRAIARRLPHVVVE